MLRTAELAQLKIDAESALMDTGTVHRRTLSQTTSGGTVASDAVLVETTACRILPTRAWTDERAGATPEIQLVQIVVPDESAAIAGDEIHISDQVFKVTGVLSRAPNVLKRLDCTRL